MSIECWIMSEVEVQLGNCCVLPRCTLFCPLLLKALAPAGLGGQTIGRFRAMAHVVDLLEDRQ